jgi:hypothetical protein
MAPARAAAQTERNDRIMAVAPREVEVLEGCRPAGVVLFMPST